MVLPQRTVAACIRASNSNNTTVPVRLTRTPARPFCAASSLFASSSSSASPPTASHHPTQSRPPNPAPEPRACAAPRSVADSIRPASAIGGVASSVRWVSAPAAAAAAIASGAGSGLAGCGSSGATAFAAFGFATAPAGAFGLRTTSNVEPTGTDATASFLLARRVAGSGGLAPWAIQFEDDF
ncbi:hypothetical protein DFJ73DRAFT_772311 [Zopfochytrium polystomum]|nr:hypothetical protein DFJ73DRAFT_772311 [Zopfochytrium polystomum]